jgi:PAS domain S-box-containing protein
MKKFFYYSPSCQRITGYPQDDLYSNSNLLTEIIYPDDEKIYNAQSKLDEVKDKNSAIEFRIVKRDGSVASVHHIYSKVFDKNEIINGRCTDTIYFKDRHGHFIKVSRALLAQYGKRLEEVISKTDFDFFGPIHTRQAFDDAREIMRTGIPIIAKEEREDMPDGRSHGLQPLKCLYMIMKEMLLVHLASHVT